MINSKDVLALIPARGGSKGLPRKNVLPLDGVPMIARVIRRVNESMIIDKIIVSSEDAEIIDISRAAGAEVPFTRPFELATDEATFDSVVEHCLRWLQDNQGYAPEFVVLIQANSPFVTAQIVDECVLLLNESNADMVYTVSQIEHPPYWAQTINDEHIPKFFLPLELIPEGARRQDMPTTYRPTGTVSAFRTSYYWKCKENNIVPGFNLPIKNQVTRVIKIDGISGLDVDFYHDYLFAQVIIKNQY